MKLLHTSDWHVGKILKGIARIDEQRKVLAEIVVVARDNEVDLVIVAGDLFESAAPSPDAQALVWATLLDLRESGAQVIVIAGNHDNGHLLEALSPLATAAGLHVVGRVLPPDEGGCLMLESRAGEHAVVACIPFLSQRYVVRSAQLMQQDAAQNAGAYAERYREVVAAMCAGFSTTTINLVTAHGFLRGGLTGGGEREAQSVEDYWIDPTAFPPTAQYVALGHLHRTQQLAGAAPIWYSGSPIQVDFGEGGDLKHVLLVEVEPGKPAKVTEHPLREPRRLTTIQGTLEQLAASAVEVGNDLLRVFVTEPARAGLANDVRDLLPNAIDIRLMGTGETPESVFRRSGRTPHELFSDYLKEVGVDDRRVEQLFSRLYDEAVADKS
jgi:DNA repair protein SbcD/Mre11